MMGIRKLHDHPGHRGACYLITGHHPLIECDKDQGEEVAKLMEKTLPAVAAEVYDDFVPFEAEVAVGNAWSEV